MISTKYNNNKEDLVVRVVHIREIKTYGYGACVFQSYLIIVVKHILSTKLLNHKVENMVMVSRIV